MSNNNNSTKLEEINKAVRDTQVIPPLCQMIFDYIEPDMAYLVTSFRDYYNGRITLGVFVSIGKAIECAYSYYLSGEKTRNTYQPDTRRWLIPELKQLLVYPPQPDTNNAHICITPVPLDCVLNPNQSNRTIYEYIENGLLYRSSDKVGRDLFLPIGEECVEYDDIPVYQDWKTTVLQAIGAVPLHDCAKKGHLWYIEDLPFLLKQYGPRMECVLCDCTEDWNGVPQSLQPYLGPSIVRIGLQVKNVYPWGLSYKEKKEYVYSPSGFFLCKQ